MKQQVNVKANFVVEFDSKWTKKELDVMIRNTLARCFHNNTVILANYSFKEEAEIYKTN